MHRPLLLLLGGLSIGVLAALPARAAGPVKLQRLDPPRAEAAEKPSRPGRAVHLSGVLRLDRRGGFTLDGRTLLLGPGCGIVPSPEPGRLPDLRRWSGRRVSVLGRSTPLGVEAGLLLLRDAPTPSGPARTAPTPGAVPSESDPSVGVLSHETPR